MAAPLLDRIDARWRGQVERADPVTLEEFGALLGQSSGRSMRTKAGVTVTPERALALPAWFRGARHLSEAIAGLPVKAFRDVPSGRRERSKPPWMAKPDRETVWYVLVEHWMMSLIHRGNAYSWKLRNDLGQVVGLRPLHPDRVRGGQASDGTKVFQVDHRTDVAWTSREILHIPGLSSDGVWGIDPIRALAETLGRQAAADEYASRHFGSGTHLAAYLSLPQHLSMAEANEMKAVWSAFHQGLQSAHEFGVLGGGAEWKTITLAPEQVQLIQSRQWGVVEVAQMLGLPPHKLYDLSRSHFNNIEHQSIESVTDSYQPYVERFEAHINADPDLNPFGNFVEWNLEGRLRGDSTARAAFYTSGVQGGWLMPHTIAELENLPAPESLRYYLRPLNMGVVDPDAPAGAQPADPTTTEADDA